MWLAMSEPIVTVYEIVQRPDGTKGIGVSLDIPISEAILMIRQGQAFAAGLAPMGVVPKQWIEDEPMEARGGGSLDGVD